MHTAIVCAVALSMGVIVALAIQLVAPMTVFGWIICVGMFTVVIAHALYPTLRLRRWSIRARHAIRRSIRRARSHRAGLGDFRRLSVGAAACCVAMLVYQTVWHPEATHAAANETSRAGAAVRFAEWSASSLPALKVAAAAAVDAEAAPVARDGVVDGPSSTSETSTRPGWAWLVDLIFTPPEPAA